MRLFLVLLAAPSCAAPLDFPGLLGSWQGRQGCTSGKSWVMLTLKKAKRGFVAEYRVEESGGAKSRPFEGRASILPTAKKRVYRFRAPLPPGNFFRMDSIGGTLQFDRKKKDRLLMKVDLGRLEAVAGISGHADVSKDRRKVVYKVNSWALKNRDDCMGSLKRVPVKRSGASKSASQPASPRTAP